MFVWKLPNFPYETSVWLLWYHCTNFSKFLMAWKRMLYFFPPPRRNLPETSVKDWRTRNLQIQTGRCVQWPTYKRKIHILVFLRFGAKQSLDNRSLTDHRVSVGRARLWTRVESEPDHDQNLDEEHKVELLVSSPTINFPKSRLNLLKKF